MNICLSDDQQNAFESIIYFYSQYDKYMFLLSGAAGTGKTLLTKFIVKHFNKLKICGIAPTHKAKKVLNNVLNNEYNKFNNIEIFTVASVLGKMRNKSYIGTKNFSSENDPIKLINYDLIIIDEASMITDVDMKVIKNFITNNHIHTIVIGDNNQLPNPSQEYELCMDEDDVILKKKDCIIFRDPDFSMRYKLNKIVRQKNGSDIIKISNYIKDNLKKYNNLIEVINLINKKHNDELNKNKYGEINTRDNHEDQEEIDHPEESKYEEDQEEIDESDINIIKSDQIYNTFKSFNIDSIRILAYTNNEVISHNDRIRKMMDFKSEFEVGEIITGYNNVGYPILIIENGMEYKILSKRYSSKYVTCYKSEKSIKYKCFGHYLKLNNSTEVFVIDTVNSDNHMFMSKIIELAEIVNKPQSTKMDYLKYSELKNNIIFIKDIYKYNDEYFNETQFKERHPLLFTNVNILIKYNEITKTFYLSNNDSIIFNKLQETYSSDLFTNRILDNKILTEQEMWKDKYKVIEKDIYYGYALTIHKSQGSTYDNVIFDSTTIDKIQNTWNFRFKRFENKFYEQNQLKYVAVTRPSKKLFLVGSN